jgi:hypothetical protein
MSKKLIPIPRYHAIRPNVPCTVACSRCKKPAIFDCPFEFLRGADAATALAVDTGVKYGGGFMREKYPDVFPWTASENSSRRTRPLYLRDAIKETWGVSTCSSCGRRSKHLLNWPHDAYYKTDVRGQTLWAWNREQAEAMRIYIASTDRKFTGIARTHFWFLRHIPNHFIEVKHRAEALKKLDRLLAKGANE